MSGKIYKKFVIAYGFFSTILVVLFFYFNGVSAENSYSKLANIYLKTPISKSDAQELAKWDVVVLHVLAQNNSAEQIKYMRVLNPDIIILAYVASEEFPVSDYKSWDSDTSGGMLHKLFRGITDDMWLRDARGNHVTFWKDYWMLNVTDYPAAGRRWNDVLSDFAAKEIMGSGLWNGVFYDNFWESVSWINAGQIDADNDGVTDAKTKVDSAWEEGMSALVKMTREKYNKEMIVVGNGDRGFYGDINGFYMENFTDASILPWKERMRLYKLIDESPVSPKVAIVAAAPNVKNQASYKAMRFGLTSALMRDGYFAYDAGSQSHAEIWWYDEYNVNLGAPKGGAVSIAGKREFEEDVWKREFENGLALVNATAVSQQVDLGSDFEKIRGAQDPKVNDGAIVSQVTMGAKDGLLMLKTFQDLKNVFFKNGDFVSFFDANGQRVRNGFFAFEDKWPSKTKLYLGDLNENGDQETIAADGPRMKIFNSRDQLWYDGYPYGGNYKGEFYLALGKLGDEDNSLLLSAENSARVIAFTYYGAVIKEQILPFGKTFAGGLTVGIGDVDNDGDNEAIIAGIRGRPEIVIYDKNLTKVKKRFFAENKNFKGTLKIAVGDVNGDKIGEILVYSKLGSKHQVKAYSFSGKKLSGFSFDLPLGGKTADIAAMDVNYDGKDDIVVMSGQ